MKIKNDGKFLFYIIFGISLFCVLFFCFTLPYHNNDEEWFIVIIVIVLMVINPILMTLFLAKICLFDIVIDAKGIHKIRFKKETFFISWDELKDIRLYNPPGLWIVFAKESLIKIKLDKARLFMKTISLAYSHEIKLALIKYCKDKTLLDKLEIKNDSVLF